MEDDAAFTQPRYRGIQRFMQATVAPHSDPYRNDQQQPFGADRLNLNETTTADLDDEEMSEKEADNEEQEVDGDGDLSTCSICFEAWTNHGQHRLVSLKCGHLFGKKCIERWLESRKANTDRKCPQCNSLANIKDIRPLYAKGLTVQDSVEVEKLRKQLESEQQSRKRAEQDCHHLRMSLAVHQAELTNLREKLFKTNQELEAIKQQSAVMQKSVNPSLVASSSSPSKQAVGLGQVSLDLQYLQSFLLCAPTDASSNKSRGMDYCPVTKTLICPKKHSMHRETQTEYGLLKVQIHPNGVSTTVLSGLHKKQIHDVRFHPRGDGLCLTVGWDKRCNIVSTGNGSILQRFDLETNPWSCCWHPTDPYLFFVGQSNSSILVFDLRYAHGPLLKLAHPGMGPQWQAVHSLFRKRKYRDFVECGIDTVQALVYQTPDCSDGQNQQLLLSASFSGVSCWNLAHPALQNLTRPSVTRGFQDIPIHSDGFHFFASTYRHNWQCINMTATPANPFLLCQYRDHDFGSSMQLFSMNELISSIRNSQTITEGKPAQLDFEMTARTICRPSVLTFPSRNTDQERLISPTKRQRLNPTAPKHDALVALINETEKATVLHWMRDRTSTIQTSSDNDTVIPIHGSTNLLESRLFTVDQGRNENLPGPSYGRFDHLIYLAVLTQDQLHLYQQKLTDAK